MGIASENCPFSDAKTTKQLAIYFKSKIESQTCLNAIGGRGMSKLDVILEESLKYSRLMTSFMNGSLWRVCQKAKCFLANSFLAKCYLANSNFFALFQHTDKFLTSKNILICDLIRERGDVIYFVKRRLHKKRAVKSSKIY